MGVKPRVLIVEDDARVARVIMRILGAWTEPTFASDGDEALRLLLHEDFDVVLCDVTMPNLTGDRLYTTLQKQRPLAAARLVFVSGWPDEVIEQMLEDVDCPTCLRKPFTPEDLTNVVREKAAASRAVDRERLA